MSGTPAPELKIPRHIAVIADGNGRWAEMRGLSRSQGHLAGARALSRLLRACRKLGIGTLTGWFFSTENWARPKAEVDYIMFLAHRFLKSQKSKFIKNKVRFRLLGGRDRLPEAFVKDVDAIERETAHFDDFCFNCCFNYGGRADLLQAVERLVADNAPITAAELERRLYTGDQPPPDLIIRTSGEQRLSGFMLWQAEYAELYFPKFHFPDFNEARLRECVEEYSRRDRRFGKVK
ncbi:MAG: di-trans,poly-cis-decaprenylcistransferase [Rickettsiales bacterium]|jgi:undecaprenyl diphosphate synthase|nr:di-trans,poly-cis-decaprenylcistransferase [Rickettsiales bacterium]